MNPQAPVALYVWLRISRHPTALLSAAVSSQGVPGISLGLHLSAPFPLKKVDKPLLMFEEKFNIMCENRIQSCNQCFYIWVIGLADHVVEDLF